MEYTPDRLLKSDVLSAVSRCPGQSTMCSYKHVTNRGPLRTSSNSEVLRPDSLLKRFFLKETSDNTEERREVTCVWHTCQGFLQIWVLLVEMCQSPSNTGHRTHFSMCSGTVHTAVFDCLLLIYKSE